MWQFTLLLICLSGYCVAGPVGLKRNMPITQRRNDAAPLAEMESATNEDPNGMMIMSTLSLPSNATSIRADITDGFSCLNKSYGYYADVENDCQIFHVCLPVTYADGKENTFRWSFICPEETIFSQDSFTCMRPDDMTISCEESYQYYELNRNFGMIDSSAEKETNNEAAESNQLQGYETILEADAELAVAKPVVQKEKEKVTVQSKPVNVQKPVRRKPSHSFAVQKKPANSYPLRKMPQSQVPESSAVPIVEDVIANIQPIEENENKPAVQKFSRRPVAAISNSFKDKIQNSKTENVMATRTELFNQMRKRPTMFNKKPLEQVEEEKQVEHVKIETNNEQQNFSPVESNMPISNTEAQAADTDIQAADTETQDADTDVQASETNHIFVKPEDSIQNIENSNNIPEESVKVLEAFEEIPAVISEVVESPNAEMEETEKEIEKSHGAEEPQIIEETQSAEEVPTVEEIQDFKDIKTAQETQEIQTADESKKAEEMQTDEEKLNIKVEQANEETSEDQNRLRTSAEEIQNIDDSKVGEEVAPETQADEETPTDEEFKVVESVKAVDETQQIEKEAQVAEEVNEAVEPQTLEEIENAEVSQMSMEHKVDDETSIGDKTKTVEETPIAEEEIPEVQQSLRTSAEVVNNNNNNENAPFAEKSPTIDLQQNEAVDEPQSPEETQEMQNEEVQTVEESQEEHIPAIQAQEGKVPITAEEALVVDEPQPVVNSIEESQVLEKTKSAEDSEPLVENAGPAQSQTINDPELVKSENTAEPAIIEENSEENYNEIPVQTIEQMESEKPAETPESMQSTEEMSHPDAVVQQMFENIDMNKQSVGGFKPVDPAMAQEAEQLIVDFINTLRNNDFTNETPGMHIEQHIDEVPEEEQSHIDDAEVQEAEKVESNEEKQEEDHNIEEEPEHQNETKAEIAETQADTVEDNGEEMQSVPEVEELQKESDAVNEEDQVNNESDDLKSLGSQGSENMKEFEKFGEAEAASMNLPQEMYQIPVKVITMTDKEMPVKEEQLQESEMNSAEITDNNEERAQEEESPAMPQGGDKPLSIDDIVELVKERLDNMPKTDMATPMQLEKVLGEAQENKEIEKKMEEQTSVQTEEEQKTNLSEEEIVMPIYQRVVQTPQLDAVVQNENSQQAINGEQPAISDDPTDIKEKTNRSYKSRSMLTPKLDSRKRHFLFKTDSS